MSGPPGLNGDFNYVHRTSSTFETTLLTDEKKTDQTKKCFGLSRLTFCLGCTLFNIALWLPLTLWVIIPAVMQSLVNHSTLTIDSVAIVNPNTQSFQAVNLQTFTNVGSISATANANYLNIEWDAPGGGQLIQLGHSNEFQVKSNQQVSMTSTATVIDEEAFANFNYATVKGDNLTWHLTGVVDVTFIVTARCSINKNVNIKGFGNFKVPPNVTQVNTTGGSPTQLFNKIVATMTSVSDITIEFGQTMHFYLLSEGIKVGIGSIPNYNLVSGTSVITADVALSSSNTREYNQLMKVLSNYSNGLDSPVVMGNFFTEEPIEWLAPALFSISMNSSMPGASSKFVVNVTMYAPLDPLRGVPFNMLMYNPIDTDTRITHISGDFIYQGVVFGTMDTDTDIYLPSHKYTMSPTLTADASTGLAATNAYLALVNAGSGLLDVANLINMNISQFPAVIDYYQQNVYVLVVK